MSLPFSADQLEALAMLNHIADAENNPPGLDLGRLMQIAQIILTAFAAIMQLFKIAPLPTAPGPKIAPGTRDE